MARLHYYQWLTNQEGQPITNANIYVYLADTTTPITVYNSGDVGATSTITTPQTTSSALGYFEFWIDDANDTSEYDIKQKFKIKWERAGVETGYIDNITLFNVELDEVDETDTGSTGSSLYKNKLISNVLAKTWNDAVVSMNNYYQLSGSIALLSSTNVPLDSATNTLLYTVPTGKTLILSHAMLIAGSDAGTSDITIGRYLTENDFITTTNLDNLNADGDAVLLAPIPSATPTTLKTYAAGVEIMAAVDNPAGGSTNTLMLFGTLY